MTGTSVTCARFDESLEELALGHVDEPERSLLLGHAASCVACRARLETTAAVGDRLLPLAPQHEPPAGFETRVLAQLAGAERAPARRSRWWVPALAAAALVLGAILGGVVGRGTGGGSGGDAVARSGVITSVKGNTRVGAVELMRDQTPYIVVTIDHPGTGGGEVYCVLRLSDGRSLKVGSWDAPDVAQHVWAVGIPPAYLDAVQMDVTTEDGTVIATARLS